MWRDGSKSTSCFPRKQWHRLVIGFLLIPVLNKRILLYPEDVKYEGQYSSLSCRCGQPKFDTLPVNTKRSFISIPLTQTDNSHKMIKHQHLSLCQMCHQLLKESVYSLIILWQHLICLSFDRNGIKCTTWSTCKVHYKAISALNLSKELKKWSRSFNLEGDMLMFAARFCTSKKSVIPVLEYIVSYVLVSA